MKSSIKKGLGFGLTSGIITTLGLIIGLYSGTGSKLVIVGGILVIAVADSFSDALGVHISEESSDKTTKQKEIWESTISTFLFKFIFAIIFLIPIWFLRIDLAVIVCIIIGILLLTFFSYLIANYRNASPIKTIFEHLGIAIVVIIVTYFVGVWAGQLSL